MDTDGLPALGSLVRFTEPVRRVKRPTSIYHGLTGEVIAHEPYDTGRVGVAVWWHEISARDRAKLGLVFPPEVLESVEASQ